MALAIGTNVGFVTVAPTADPAGTDTVIDGASVVVRDLAPAGATRITEIGWYRGSGTNTANFEVGLYTDTAGVADVRDQVDATNSSASSGWIRVAVNWPITELTWYWLAVQMDAHTGSSNIDTAASGGSGIDRLTSQTTLGATYGGGAVLDADGMYAIYALIGVNQVASPGVGALTLTGLAPTVFATNPKNVLPALGEISLDGFAPTASVSVNQFVNADVGALTLEGFVPVVTIANPNINAQPGLGELTLSGYAPTAGVSINVSVPVGELTFEGYLPSVDVSVSANQIRWTGRFVSSTKLVIKPKKKVTPNWKKRSKFFK